MENVKVGMGSFLALGLGALLMIVVPIAVAVYWIVKKKERVTTVLVGAAVFLLFAVILEKLIQNALIFPTEMGLAEHAVSRFVNARPVLWALIVGLFPGVFEETGRLVAFRTVLKNRKNRETSISYGIGHGCFEVILYVGITYITYVSYAVMMNTGAFQTVIDKVAQQAPGQADALKALTAQIASFSFADLGTAFAERIFAVLFHIGASILVFFACRDRKRFWLFPLAVILHTAMDFAAGLYLGKVMDISAWALEGITAAFGILTFCGAYFLLYKKDKKEEQVYQPD